MLSEDFPNAGSYWSTVAQIVPVLTVAIVIEARRTSSRWKIEDRAARLIDSVLYVSAAAFLVLVFFWALTRLASSDPAAGPDLSPLVNWLLAYIVAIVVLGPLLAVALRGNADTLVLIADFMPWSKWRSWRRIGKRLRTDAREAVERSLVALEEAEEMMSAVQQIDVYIERADAKLAETERSIAALDLDAMEADLGTRDAKEAKVLIDRYKAAASEQPLLRKRVKKAIKKGADELVKSVEVFEQADGLLRRKHLELVNEDSLAELKRTVESASKALDAEARDAEQIERAVESARQTFS